MAAPAQLDYSGLRPLDRVFTYLEREIPGESKRAGVKLPTTREVSRHILVSPATVRNAYQQLAARGLVKMEVGSGSFWTASAGGGGSSELVIGINLNSTPVREHSNTYTYRIFGGLLHGVFHSGRSVRLEPVPIAPKQAAAMGEAALAKRLEGLDGFILIPYFSNQLLDRMLNDLALPHVSLNPLSVSDTAGFVSPDYLGANRRVGRAFVAAGRKRVLLFLAPGTERSVSCQLRLAGFLSGLHAGEVAPECRKLVVETGSLEQARRAFSRFLDGGWVPDAVCTAGDDMALAVLKVAEERGIQVPHEMSVVGGNGLAVGIHGKNSSLTTMVQPLERVGEELMRLLQRQRERPETPVPGVVLPMDFWIGKTTLAAENRVLTASNGSQAP